MAFSTLDLIETFFWIFWIFEWQETLYLQEDDYIMGMIVEGYHK
jgi:hypothetical protein